MLTVKEEEAERTKGPGTTEEVHKRVTIIAVKDLVEALTEEDQAGRQSQEEASTKAIGQKGKSTDKASSSQHLASQSSRSSSSQAYRLARQT